MKSFFERAGIYGYPYATERAMLASLLTGTPVLLLGKIGEAKTQAAQVIAHLLLGSHDEFLKIAADKVQFEDLIGFPQPKALAEGIMQFVKSKTTIWDKRFILVDEISRCNPQLQNKFLELILERQVMGIQTGVQWVWATMNPLEYAGSQPLDGALAGRMGYVIEVPQTVKHPEELIQKIAESKNYAQTPALSYWLGERYEYKPRSTDALRAELKRTLETAAKILGGLEDHWTPVIAKYLAAWLRSLHQGGLEVDGRRLVMMRYNIISNIAIQTAQTGRALSMDEVKQLCKEVIPRSIPWLATGMRETFDPNKFVAAHNMAAPLLDAGDSLIYRIVTEQDSLRKLRMFIEHRAKIDPMTATSLVTSLYDKPAPGETVEDTWRAEATLFALRLAMPYLFLRLDNIPSEAVAVVAKQYPIDLSTKEKPDLGSITVTSYKQAKKLAELYEQLRASKSHVDWASAYWAFFAGAKSKFTFDQVIQRFEIVHEAIREVAQELHQYIPQKVAHVSSAAAAVSDLLDDNDEAEDQEAAPVGRLLAGVTI